MKRLLSILSFLLCLAHISAQGVDSVTLVISGNGVTKQDATHAALRNAIEQTYGVFVSANTEILNDSLVKDEIITIASGNVYSYHELGASVLPNGNHEVTLQATLSTKQLVAYAQSKGATCELVNAANFAASSTANIKLIRLNQQNTIKAFENLKKQLLQIATQSEIVGFRLNVGEPQVRDSYAEVLKCNLSIQTEAYWKQGALQFVELMSNTLNALQLTQEQMDQLDHYGISSHTIVYNTLKRTPDGCKIEVTTGKFYAELNLTTFLTDMMNSLLNPYYIKDNLNNKYEGNVAYDHTHTTLFQDEMYWDNSQLTNEDLGLITYKKHFIILPLDTFAKISTFEIEKFDMSNFFSNKTYRMIIPDKAMRYDTYVEEKWENYSKRTGAWRYSEICGDVGYLYSYCYFTNEYDYSKCYRPGIDEPIYLGKLRQVDINGAIQKFLYYNGFEMELPIAYDKLKSYYQKRGVQVSLKALSSTKTLVSLDYSVMRKLHCSFEEGVRIYESSANVNGKIGYTIDLKPSLEMDMFPKWNGILLE